MKQSQTHSDRKIQLDYAMCLRDDLSIATRGECMTNEETCGACNGSRRMPRDPDIGTDQECFVCDGSAVIAAHEAKAVPSRADQLVRKYIECLTTNDPDGASDATKSMVDYVFNCPPATAHEAKAAPAVPQGVIYEKADSLYKRGYTDRQTGKDYDPRGCDEWQEVVDWLPPAAPVQEPAVPQGEPVAWFEYNESLDAWFLAYSRNPNAKTRPLVFGDVSATPAAPSQPVTLTDDEIIKAMRAAGWPDVLVRHVEGARQFVDALREKGQAK